MIHKIRTTQTLEELLGIFVEAIELRMHGILSQKDLLKISEEKDLRLENFHKLNGQDR